MSEKKEGGGFSLDMELTVISYYESSEAVSDRIAALEAELPDEASRQVFRRHLVDFLGALRETRTPPEAHMIDSVYNLTVQQGPDFPVQ